MPGSGPTPPPFPPYPPGGGSGRVKDIVSRVRDILTQPKQEWAVIEGEPSTVASLFTGYAMILAAIGPLATILGYLLVRIPITYGLTVAIIGYVIALGGVFLNGIIINALAPTFGGTPNQVQAMKVAVYSATPVWLVGILNLLPQIAMVTGLLAILALIYGLYILYLGLPRLMRVTEDKAVGYVVVVIAAWIVIWALLTFVIMSLVMGMVYGSALGISGLRGY
jgi:hypothetical protein